MTPDPGPLPQFQASPVVTVDVMGKPMSLVQARDYSDAIHNHLKAMLVPVSDWDWVDELDQETLLAHHCFLYRPGKQLVAKDGGMLTTWDWRRFKVAADGFVELRDDGLWACWFRRFDLVEQVGLTNDLLDAKYLVAEAWRAHMKAAAQPAQTETTGNDPTVEIG
jgi:hypothetical protein